MEVQSVLFNKKKYTKKQAEKWLMDNKYKVKKVDITENLRRYRQLDPKLFNKNTYRMKKLKGNDLMLVMGKRLVKGMDMKKVPAGSHRMKDGTIMKDSVMKKKKKPCDCKDHKKPKKNNNRKPMKGGDCGCD